MTKIITLAFDLFDVDHLTLEIKYFIQRIFFGTNEHFHKSILIFFSGAK